MKAKKVDKSLHSRRLSTREKLIEIRTNPENWEMTQAEAGKLLGVTRQWIVHLEAESAFWEEVFAINKRNAKGKDAAIWRSMCKEAMDGSFFQQKLYFEMTGQYKNQMEITNKMTLSEIIDLIPDENKL